MPTNMAPRQRLCEVAISRVAPEGWLRRYLELQREGLTGHLEQAGYPFDTGGWSNPRIKALRGEPWFPYEQTAYWHDGMIRCAYLLQDPDLLARALKPIRFVLAHPDRDGYLGPPPLKGPGNLIRWSHAVFFRAVMAHHGATGDRSILRTLSRHYLSRTCPHTNDRDVCNVEIMCWLYGQTGDRRLLREAGRAYRGWTRRYPKHDCTAANLLSGRRATEHGVTFNEFSKLGAVLAMHNNDRRLLRASINAYRKVDRDQMLIDGVPSSSEALKGRDPLDSHETCDIADFTWSMGYLLMATGEAACADKIERACFNAAPGAVRADFKALQYFSCPNQVVADHASNHNQYHAFYRAYMAFAPNAGTECCPGAVNRIMPNYAARMWMRDGRGGLVAALYGPSRIALRIGAGRGTEVTVVQETDYPFGERVDFQFRCARSTRFPFSVRIPAWCRRAAVLVNGVPWHGARPEAGTFVTLDRTFAPNDRVTVLLPMNLRLSRWPRGGVGIERGPLAYALRIEEDWRVHDTQDRCSPEFPAWDLYAASPWNYALAVSPRKLAEQIELLRRPMSPEPWSIHAAPLELRVPARRVRGWALVRRRFAPVRGLKNGRPVTHRAQAPSWITPPLPDPRTLQARLGRSVETVTLVPYGCTKLRISVFPWANGG